DPTAGRWPRPPSSRGGTARPTARRSGGTTACSGPSTYAPTTLRHRGCRDPDPGRVSHVAGVQEPLVPAERLVQQVGCVHRVGAGRLGALDVVAQGVAVVGV